MKFDGKQLFALGCPQNRIKFLVNVEFESEEELKKEFFPEKQERENLNYLTTFDWLWDWSEKGKFLPMVLRGDLPVKMSKSELRRILDSEGVQINGLRPMADFSMWGPVKEIIFFPNSKRKTTMR